MRRVLVVLAALLTLAACGDDGDGNGVATAGGSKSDGGGAGQEQVDDDEARRQFAECMRKNGVDVPDPEPGKPPRMQLRGERGKVDKAMEACRELLPNGGDFKPDAKDVEAMRKMAECMRDNGVPDFPDPDPNGGGIRIGKGSGIDPEDPDFQAAQEKCREFLPERTERPGGDR